MNRIPYTEGGNTRPYDPPFAVRFKVMIPKFKISYEEELKTYIIKMAKSDKIMLFPPEGAAKDFYIVVDGEQEVLDMIDFIDLPEYNLTSWNPPEDSGTDVVLPY
jgi:hypothetical protein